MAFRSAAAFLVAALVSMGSLQKVGAQSGGARPATAPPACVGGMSEGKLTLHAARSGTNFLSLCNGRTLPPANGTAGEPLTLTSGDFDEDGVPDLVHGFRSGSGGGVTVYRGNVDALWPYGAALRNGPPPAFLGNPKTFSLPEAPDFLVAGDFDADGHWDLLAAQRGSSALYLLRGNGHGSFAPAERIEVGGRVTQMIAGEINRPDGLIDVIVGVDAGNGSKALVYESPNGAMRGQPEIIDLPQSATGLALGRFDGEALHDLVIAAGSQLVVVHGRDRRLSTAEAGSVGRPRVTMQGLGFTVRALVGGSFTGTGPGVAALDEQGVVHLLEHAIAPNSMLAKAAQTVPTMLPAGAKPGDAPAGGTMSPVMAGQMAAVRQSVASGPKSEWTEKETVAMPGGFSQTISRLVAAQVTGAQETDLLVPDSGNRKVHVLSRATERTPLQAAVHTVEGVAPYVAPRMRVLASVEAESEPVAVLPMRLNQHGLQGLVTLHSGDAAPTISPQDVPPANIFTVTNTQDLGMTGAIPIPNGPAGSLRAAMNAASGASGTSEIVFNIPTTDPGYNAATGVYTIKPYSEGTAAGMNFFALPPINETVTIDGYTQPGASPNTLAAGDNAKIVIQIDGSLAVTPGGDGLIPYDDVGSVYRGMDFTNWVNYGTNAKDNSSYGASGLEAFGVSDFVEGNFSGVDPTGTTAMPNHIGVFSDNGPGFGFNSGNIIGGTTPQARNVLSGNKVFNLGFLEISFEGQAEGDYIGTDATGTKAITATGTGVTSNGPTIVVGGTLAGDGNLISGNYVDVDFNDELEGGAAANSTAQGNLLGTDATGTKAILNPNPYEYGVSLQHNPQHEFIGGTTPAARNVIGGNYVGVFVLDNDFYNLIQGNYVGVDVTGTKPIPNGTGFSSSTSGGTGNSGVAPAANTLGGTVAGAGNVISGNNGDGVLISGTSIGPGGMGYGGNLGSTVQGNYIGTDAGGTLSLGNGGSGVHLSTGATNNLIGGTNLGSGNQIAHNGGNGVLVDPGTAGGLGTGNQTVANTILSNGGTGVRVLTGTGERISRNSIYGNGALGIDIDAAGENAISHCQVANSGANGLQNAPVLTVGAGNLYISATATDPNGNTSEFSNTVAVTSVANVLTLLGTFDSKPSTTYSIEFFSNPAPDASGFGQGQTYLGSTSVTTGAGCTGPIIDPVTTTGADVAVSLAAPNVYALYVGPDMGNYTYAGTVTNNGAATAHNVTFVDTLPAQLAVSSVFCNVASCQSPITTTQGTCTVSGQTVTCNLGTMAPGATAVVTIPVQTLTAGSITNTATVSATENDPNLANNTSSVTTPADYPSAAIDHLSTTTSLTLSSPLPLTIYGLDLLPNATVQFNGTTVPITGVVDNQTCGGQFQPYYCGALQVTVPAALLGTPGTYAVTVQNPDPGPGGYPNTASSANFTIVSSCTYTFFTLLPTPPSTYTSAGTGLGGEFIEVAASAPTCTYTASSSVPWISILDNTTATGSTTVDLAVAANTGAPRTGTITIAGQVFTLTQDGGASCAVTTTPTTVPFSTAGGHGSVTTSAGASCGSYFVDSYAPWITVDAADGLLSGPATIGFTVAPNTGPARTGTILAGSATITVIQAAPSCYFVLTPTSALVGEAGGTGSLTVAPTPSSCSWTATSSDTTSVTVTSGASGTGNGTVSYSVAKNTGGPRMPTITVGNAVASSAFTVNQTAGYACTFTVSPTAVEVPSNGVSNNFAVNASYSFCKWTAASNNPTGLSVAGPNSGTGSGTVYYTVAQNPSTTPRVLTITAGCQTFTVNQDGSIAGNPVPTISSLLPTSVTAGSGAFTLTVNGTNFIAGSVVNFNGVARTTTYVSATQLTAAILASDVATAGTVPVTVTNPAPGGGTSNAVNFQITVAANPVPTISSLQPTSVTAGSGAFTLTVTGTNFISGSVVNFNGVARTTTYVSATQLTAAILASDVLTAGTVPVTVTNPAPGGGTSNAVNFQITVAANPVPTITSLQPTSVTAGASAFTLTVNGTNFISSSVVKFNGAARTTTYVSATQLTASIVASDVATAGTEPVTVTNPTPGGGTSNSVNFQITAAANPVPTITSLQPASVGAGSGAFTLTVNGTNFISASVVNFNGVPRTTAYVSATQLTASIIASDVATAGTAPVTVTNPTPGGGTSNSVSFQITPPANPAPTLTSLQPTSVTAGTGAFTLTLTGTGFISSSVVNFNGAARTTTYVSATQLTAAVLGSDVAAAGMAPVTVTNPSPGGGTSNALTFTINAPGAPVAGLSPTALTFANQTVITTSAAQTLTLSNTGNAALTISSISIGGANASSFAQTNTCGAPLAAGTSCSISVTFTPSTTGSLTATVSVADNATGSPQTAGLTGTGVAVTAPAVTLSPTALSFSSQTVSTTSTAQSVVLSNTGNAPLTLTSVTITGSNAGSFTQTNNCGASVAASTSCTISVTFTPATAGALTATLSVADNASGSPQNVSLTGTGVGTPAATFGITSSTASQTVPRGGTAQYSLTVAAQNGSFSSAVVLSVTGLPSGAKAAFVPASVTPGSGSASSVLTIQVPVTSALWMPTRSRLPLTALLFPLFGLLFARRSRRPRLLSAVVVTLITLASASMIGCGGGFGLPSSTYNLTITGTGAGQQQSTTVQLTVQ